MKKQLMIAIVCISGVGFNVAHAAAAEHREIIPRWVEVRWADCVEPDNVKHFEVGTKVEEISTVFSALKKSVFFTVTINDKPKDGTYRVQEGDYGVIIPSFIRPAVEGLCTFVGDLIEPYNQGQIDAKIRQNNREQRYNAVVLELIERREQDKIDRELEKLKFHEKTQSNMAALSELSQEQLNEKMRPLSWKRSAYAQLGLKMPQKLSDISKNEIDKAYNLVIKKYNSEKENMTAEEVEAVISKIERAYDILSDSVLRRRYDAEKMKGW